MKAVINALTLALLESQLADMLVVDAKSFAEQFVRENAELFVSPTPALRLPPPFQWPEGSGQSAEDAPVERVTVHHVPIVGADGLREAARRRRERRALWELPAAEQLPSARVRKSVR